MTMKPHYFQTIQKEQPHGSGTNLFIQSAFSSPMKYTFKFFKNHRTHVGMLHILKPYYFPIAPSV